MKDTIAITIIIVALIALSYVIDSKQREESALRQAKFADCMSEIHNVAACEEWTK